MKHILVSTALLALLVGVPFPAAMVQRPGRADYGPLAMDEPRSAFAVAALEDVLYSWDFEADDGGFVGTLDWEWGAYAWVGAACDSYNLPPPGAYSGAGMWGAVLNDCYANRGNNQGYNTCINTHPADDSILSFTVDLTGVTTDVELSWWEWYDLFMPWDWAEVYVNGDVVFQHCGGNYVEPTAWQRQVVDLTPYIGGPVTIEFHMMASTVVNHAGWYIDDVMIVVPHHLLYLPLVLRE